MDVLPRRPRGNAAPTKASCRIGPPAAVYGVGHLVADIHEFTLSHRRQTRHLLREREDPEAVAQIVAESIRRVFDYPGSFAETLAQHAARFGFKRGDGLALLRWFLSLVGDAEADVWMAAAAQSVSDSGRSTSAGEP
jgi:hypothetical protein